MVCEHLSELYQLCVDQQIVLSSSDLVRVVCKQCDEQEVCPSVMMDEYDATTGADDEDQSGDTGTPTEPPAAS